MPVNYQTPLESERLEMSIKTAFPQNAQSILPLTSHLA